MTRTSSSIRDLARQVGRSHQSVGAWIKHPHWDQSRQPPWDVDKAIRWSQRALAPDPNAVPLPDEPAVDSLEGLKKRPMSAAKLKLVLARALKLELERKLLAGELVERAEVELGLIRRVHTVRAAFEALPRQVAGALVGQSENEIERFLGQAIAGVLTGISQRPALTTEDGVEY